jgi:hypothetical protein
LPTAQTGNAAKTNAKTLGKNLWLRRGILAPENL